jgi:hypothetical protein
VYPAADGDEDISEEEAIARAIQMSLEADGTEQKDQSQAKK